MPAHKKTLEERFASLTKRSTNRCLEWTGSLHGQGYGCLRIDGVTRTAHRAQWERLRGPTNGSWVLHRCDNRKCVEPTHLFLGTAKDNSQDMVRKGRSAKGEKQGLSKLTSEEVRRIKSLPKKEFNRHAEAARLGVRPETLDRIRRGVDWAHI